MDVPKLGRGRGRGKTFKEFETISRFIGRGRGRGKAAIPAQKIEDETSSTSSEGEVPKQMRRGRGRGRPKELESVSSPIESGRDIIIRAGCSKSVKPAIDPVEEIEAGTSVEWDPFTLLPKEIYLKIFNKLEDPNDKRRFMNAHAKWYDLFKYDRSLFLFGNVLEALAQHGNGIDRTVLLKNNDGYTYENVTRDSNGLSDSDYLNLRLVCRDWDAAFQAYILHHPSHYRLGGERAWYSGILVPIFETDWVLRKQFRWRNAHELEAELENFSLTHPPSRNPFLTRNIRLEFRSHGGFEEAQNYWAQVDTLLETYGRYIWHCQFTFYMDMTPENFSLFVKWLSLMPDLRTLEISGYSWGYDNDNGQAISDIELPEMTKLSVIKCHQFELAYFNELLGGIKGPLEKISIGNEPIYEVNCLSSVPRSSAYLQEYQIPANVTEARLLLGHIGDIDYLKEMPYLARLRKLKLHFNFQDETFLWETIWKVVEETFPQLEELNLEMPRVPIGKDRKVHEKTLNCRLNMPKLKKLRVVLPNLASLDFLLPLKELEELQIVMEYVIWDPDEPKELGEKEIIDCNKMDLGNMWESNIWEVLPKLRKLHIKAIGKPSEDIEERRDGCFPFSFVYAPDPYKGESEWHLYGYAKEGMNWESIYYDPSKPWKEMYKLFYTSQSYM